MNAALQFSAEFLRSARPRLLIRSEISDEGMKLSPYVSDDYVGWDEILDEGYDPDGSPLGCPVYWRVVRRGDQRFYLSTHPVSRDQIVKIWGSEGLSFCDPITHVGIGRIENLLPERKAPLFDPRPRDHTELD